MLNLGTLLFGLGVDTRALAAARNRVQEFGRTVETVQRQANRGIETNINVLRRQENTILSALSKLRVAQEQIRKADITPRMRTDAIERLNREFNNLTKNVSSAARGLDPTRIDRAAASWKQNVDQITRSVRQTAQGSVEADRYAATLHRAAEQARNLAAQIERSAHLKPGQITGLTGRIESGLQGLRTGMAGAGTQSEARAFQREWQSAINSVKRSFQDLTAKGESGLGLFGSWRSSMRGLGDAALLVNGHFGGLSTRIFALNQLIADHGYKVGVAAGAVAGLSAAVIGLSASVIRTGIEFEKIGMSLQAVAGNSYQAAVELDYVKQTSNQAGLVIQDVAKSYAKFNAASKAAGLTSMQTRDIFSRMSMAAGTLQLSVEDTQGVFKALEQMLSKGTVQAEELRGQLGDRLPGAFSYAAAAMGKTTAELGKMMKAGDLISSDFLPKFAEVVTKALGIDMTQPIQTLQAELNRTTNATDNFYLAIIQQTDIMKIAADTVKTFNNALEWMTANMDQVAGAIGGLAGALAGLATVMMVTYVMSWIQGMGGLIAIVARAAVAVRTLTAAIIALNWAVMASPIGRILGFIAKLVTVVGGAVLGYELMTKMVEDNNAALANAAGIREHIELQKKLGFQIEATTQKMLNQLRTQALTQAAAVNETRGRLLAAKEGLEASLRKEGRDPSKTSLLGATMIDPLNAVRIGQSKNTLRDQVAGLRETTALLRSAIDLSKLPTEVPMPSGIGIEGKKDKTPKGESVEASVNRIQDIMDAARRAGAMMAELFKGPKDLKLIDDLFAARDVIRDMSDKELAAAAAEMGITATAGENLRDKMVNALVPIITKTREAEEAMEAFRRVWENIDRDLNEASGLQKQLDALTAGAEAWDVQYIKALHEAQDALRKIDPATESGQQALEAIRQKLLDAGFAGDVTAEALAKLYLHLDRLNDGVRAAEQLNKKMEDLARSSMEVSLITQAYGRGAGAGEQMERMLSHIDDMRDMAEAMRAVGKSSEEINDALTKMAENYDKLDKAKIQMERAKRYATQLRDAYRQVGDDIVDALFAVAEGTKSVGQAIEDVFMNLAKRLMDNAIERALDVIMDAIFPAKAGANANSVGASAAKAAPSLTAMTMAAYAATAALNSLAVSAGGSPSAGGGGGGILGSIIGGLGSIFKTVIGGTTQANTAGARAMGGPVTAGWSYLVNEQGAKGEIFTPGVSGWVGQPNGGQGAGTTIVDLSMTIDARGATPDAVAALRSEMQARESKLRAMIPYYVDQRVSDGQKRGRI